MFIVIAYDVSDNKRRNKLHKALKSFGEPVEESVFEADIDQARWQRMFKRVQQIIVEEDKVRFYFLCEDCRNRIVVINGTPPTAAPKRVIV